MLKLNSTAIKAAHLAIGLRYKEKYSLIRQMLHENCGQSKLLFQKEKHI